MDEFTVLEDKEEELKCARPRVEQVFKVKFTIIGLLDHTGQPHGSKTSRQIWLQLRGNREDVSKAKVRACCSVSLAISTNQQLTVTQSCDEHTPTCHRLYISHSKCIFISS